MTNLGEQQDISTSSSASFSITEPMLLSLSQTKPWAMLLSIVGFISIGILIILGVINIFVTSYNSPDGSIVPAIVGGGINILMGVLYFFPSLFLFKFASSIGRLIDNGGAREMEESLSYQKSAWKFIGILTLVTFAFAILGIAAAIIIPYFARMAG